MILDLTLLILVVIAIIKGFRRGLIVAVFSLVALVIGIAAALKLSAVVANRLRDSVNVSSKWLPILSFVLVFVAVVILIRIAAKLIEASVEMAWLGGVNKLGGIVFYLVIYILAYSVILFFLVQAKFISDKTIADSVTYPYIEPWGRVTMNVLGNLIPAFKNVFADLESFFENLAQKIPAASARM